MDSSDKAKVLKMHKENPKYSHQTIADKLDLTRSAVWRVLSGDNNTPLDTTLWSDEEKAMYDEFKTYQKNKEKKPWYTRIIPLKRTLMDGSDIGDLTGDYTLSNSIGQKNNFLDNYYPQYGMRPLDVTLNDKTITRQDPFVAKTKANGQVVFPKFFFNPYNALDMIVLQDIYMRTICGTIIDILVAFTMGKGIKPVLKLNSKNEDEIKKIKPHKGSKKICKPSNR